MNISVKNKSSSKQINSPTYDMMDKIYKVEVIDNEEVDERVKQKKH